MNYTFHATDAEKRVAAHFRAHDPEKHLPDCEWRRRKAEDDSDAPLKGETEEQTFQRRMRRKLTDLITEFDPSDPSSGEIGGNGDEVAGQPGGPRGGGPHPSGGPAKEINPRTRSRDLERLVQTWLEAKEALSRDEFRGLMLRVKGVGNVSLADYFQPISRCDENTSNVVIYGGARWEQAYGKGFRLRFFDFIQKCPVFLYVSAAQMDEFRHRNYLRGIVDRIAAHKYVRVYANGSLRRSATGKSYNLEVTHLRHLALTLGPKLDAEVETANASSPS